LRDMNLSAIIWPFYKEYFLMNWETYQFAQIPPCRLSLAAEFGHKAKNL